MAARVSGNKVVSVAVAGMVTFVGIGAIYVPFFADRDKLRGLHEESAPPTSAMLAQEIRKLQQEGLLKSDDEGDSGSPKSSNQTTSQRSGGAPGSMWKQFK
jgi:hypothetical protein